MRSTPNTSPISWPITRLWCPKYRKKILVGKLATFVEQEIRRICEARRLPDWRGKHPVNFDMKQLIFRQLSWREYFSSFGFGSAISQKLVKEKTSKQQSNYQTINSFISKFTVYYHLCSQQLGRKEACEKMQSRTSLKEGVPVEDFTMNSIVSVN